MFVDSNESGNCELNDDIVYVRGSSTGSVSIALTPGEPRYTPTTGDFTLTTFAEDCAAALPGNSGGAGGEAAGGVSNEP